MALYAMGPLIGPVIGPMAGGFATESIGWRWTFWILAVAVSSCPLFSRRSVTDPH
jgi:MFS family permease